jgi:UDP-N-acetylglucosamine 2-epimerase (non-hydrolysing)
MVDGQATGPGPVMCVVGARPNFMKMAPILRALAARAADAPALLVHTGQHYDQDMNDRLFADLGLPRRTSTSASARAAHAVQTAEVMKRFEPALDEHQPSCVLVVGDVNSTLACTLVAVKKGIPVAHVEAGLRSYDRTMPRRSTACSPTRWPTGCTPPSAARRPTCSARAWPPIASSSPAT